MHWFGKHPLLAFVLAAGLSLAAQAQYLAVLSTQNPAAPTLTILNAGLEPLGTVAVPTGSRQVLLSDDGNKLIVIADNAAAPVSFITIGPGSLSAARTLALGAGGAARGLLSADGTRLVVLTRNPPSAQVVLVGTELVDGPPQLLPGEPLDAELTLDGSHLLVLCSPNLLVPIRMETWQALAAQTVAGVTGTPKLSLSIAPSGSVFISAPGSLIELRGQAPFEELARTALSGTQMIHPGKLQFMPPAGMRAFAANQVQSGHSVGFFELSLRGAASPAGTYVGGAALSGSSSPSGGLPELIEPLLVTRDQTAYGLAPATGQTFAIGITPEGAVTATEFRVGQIPVTGIEDMTSSREFPNAVYLFYNNTQGFISRFPLTGLGGVMSRQIVRGRLMWLQPPSTAPAGSLYGFGLQSSVPPLATLRYYVRAIDASGHPAKGRTITFQAITPGVQLAQSSATTNRDGWAFVDVTAPGAAPARGPACAARSAQSRRNR